MWLKNGLYATFFCMIQLHGGVTAQLATMIDPLVGGTITNAGSYYLDWNVTGTITIAVSNITLDFNHHIAEAHIIINSFLNLVTSLLEYPVT